MCAANIKTLPVHLLGSDVEYNKLGLARSRVAPWEDGLRSDPEKIDYEWWYFNTELNDDSKIVIVFYTKPYTGLSMGLNPKVDFTLTRPNGENITQIGMTFKPVYFKASKRHCDVNIAKNYFRGDLLNYEIHVEFEGFSCDVALKNSLRAWRSQTGIRYYGNKMFNWLIAVPNGETTVTLNHDGKTETLTGVGYHDHNWGDEELSTLVHHWYWARGKIGDYFAVIAYVYSEAQYGHAVAKDFLLAKDGKIVADNGKLFVLKEIDLQTDKETGKPYAKTLEFDYSENDKKYQITLATQDIIQRKRFHDAKNGAYLRFSGQAAVKRFKDDKMMDESSDTAIWEMMYFGLPLG